MNTNDSIITPQTKVLTLIETYPQLEDVLIGYVPAFKKLKNPLLRRTVAKVATLQQAAAIGKVRVEELINLLRKEVGQDSIDLSNETTYNAQKPDWFSGQAISNSLDLREMLNAGEQPIGQVISDLKKLEPGEIYKIIAPFIPAPLIDKATSLGMDHWISEFDTELFIVYFTKK